MYPNIFQPSSPLLLTSIALLRTRTFGASPQTKKKSSPSLLVAVAMTTAINLIVLLALYSRLPK